MTFHVVTVPDDDNNALGGGHFAVQRLIVEKVVRSVGGGGVGV